MSRKPECYSNVRNTQKYCHRSLGRQKKRTKHYGPGPITDQMPLDDPWILNRSRGAG